MPQNRIQFQPGMYLDDFFTCFGTEAQCALALKASRWSHGFVCPHCGVTTHCRFHVDGYTYWQCIYGRVQASLKCATLFESSKLALTKWLQAMYLVIQNKNNLSALSLKRHRAMCYRTASRLYHELLEALSPTYRISAEISPKTGHRNDGSRCATRISAASTGSKPLKFA